MDTPKQVWFTRAEAAEYLRVTTATLDNWVRDGRIPKHKVMGLQSVRFRVGDLDALFAPAPDE
ncbi:MAG: DNA-binding protein [Chitinophagaceae bacterium]|nr:MAG: DNA-binding protein [Chitinophagaceae bacterium]